MSEQNAEREADATDEDGTEADDGGIDELAARVAAHDEELAAEVEAISERVDELEAEVEERDEEIDELEERLKRERADFQNYKKRVEDQKEEIRERATENLVERLLDVRDNLLRALDQDDDADLRDGVEATFSTFERVLEDEGVETIEPDIGDEVNPQVHEVMMRVEGDQPEDTIEEVYRPGYRMAGKVLRPAQVAVSEGGSDERDVESDEADEEASDEEASDEAETAEDA